MEGRREKGRKEEKSKEEKKGGREDNANIKSFLLFQSWILTKDNY
jgi:hypothetical protein